MICHVNNSPRCWVAALYAGVAAGILATIVQIALWWSFWDVLPGIFYRDVRYTAAILLGKESLQASDTLSLQHVFIATSIHVGLSIIYAIGISYLIRCLNGKDLLMLGGLFGLGIFVINMYGFVLIFPWFVETRDWITVTSHIVFGMSAASVYKALTENDSYSTN